MNDDVKPVLIKSLLNDYFASKCLAEDDYENRASQACRILQDNIKNVSEKRIESRRIYHNVKDQIKDFWGLPLDLLELQVQFSKEAAGIAANLITFDDNFKAISLIHGRGCHIATEIWHLLRGGFSDGAEARWRTLYELSIISEFILLIGEDIGKRYLAYESVEIYKFYNAVINNYESLDDDLDPEIRIDYEKAKKTFYVAKKDVESYCEVYGKIFKENYGWAADALDIDKPRHKINFDDIQKKGLLAILCG